MWERAAHHKVTDGHGAPVTMLHGSSPVPPSSAGAHCRGPAAKSRFHAEEPQKRASVSQTCKRAAPHVVHWKYGKCNAYRNLITGRPGLPFSMIIAGPHPFLCADPWKVIMKAGVKLLNLHQSFAVCFDYSDTTCVCSWTALRSCYWWR